MDARVERLGGEARAWWRPPPRLNLSVWADENFYLSAESSAEPGRWRSIPYQRGIMDAVTDPRVEFVTVLKSARVGATKIIVAAIAYHMQHDPCAMMVVQPTVEDAQGFSKEEIAPMLRDVPAVRGLVRESGPRSGDDTILQKLFPGGSLTLVGANSGRGFRRVSRRVVFFDEVDAYPPSAGTEGDQIRLGIMRTQSYWNRKVVACSTPLIAGHSRISELYEEGDRRRYFVPCPSCGHMDVLTFREQNTGHFMRWPEGQPEAAYFVCGKNGCVIEHSQKRWMIEHGEWRAEAPFLGHASFSIWAAYSFAANATWGQLAQEFVTANEQGPEKLKTFVNTWLGEAWQERGEAPDWTRLYQRREPYERGTVPPGTIFLTAGVDVQRDRLVWEVVGWGADKQSWTIDADVLPGDTAGEEVWNDLDALLARTWPGLGGNTYTIHTLAIDSGYNTNQVYSWARRHPMTRVIACKGSASARVIIGAPSAVDVTIRGKRMARGYKVWIVGMDVAKSELYGWLHLDPPADGAAYPPGFCHFPAGMPEEFFRQLTAEQLATVVTRLGYPIHEWQMIPGRENHWLDTRNLARAAAARAGLDRYAAARNPVAPPPAPAPPPTPIRQAPQEEGRAYEPAEARAGERGPRRSSWLGDRAGGTVSRGWLSRRR